MRLLIYLGAVAIMLMAFEVKATWHEFDQGQVDISPWLYEETASFSKWEEYITLGGPESSTILIEEKSLSSNELMVAVAQRVTNISSAPYCLVVKSKQAVNTINSYLRDGKTIVSPGETIAIGGYRLKSLNKHWQVNWSFQATKNLEYCRE